MRKTILLAILVTLAASCTKQIEADKNLSTDQYQKYLKSIAPFCMKKPDRMEYADRANPTNSSFYDLALKETQASLKFFAENDTAKFFMYRYKDITSLYEHYRALGGYFKTNEKDSLVFINFLYHTPRFTAEEMEKKGSELFREMIKTGNVNKYLGDKKYIHTPNTDFYYNTKLNKWDYTENSSWKFLDEAKKRAKEDSIH